MRQIELTEDDRQRLIQARRELEALIEAINSTPAVQKKD